MTRKKLIRTVFLLAALGFGAWAVAGSWSRVADGFARLSWPLLAGSLVAVLGALVAGMLMWRALLAGIVVNLIVWRCAIVVWCHIILAELRAAEERHFERRREAHERVAARAAEQAEQAFRPA